MLEGSLSENMYDSNKCSGIMMHEERRFVLDSADQVILGIDPGLANTGWGVIRVSKRNLSCLAYGCISTPSQHELSARLYKIYEQIRAVVHRYEPVSVGIESVWFGENSSSAFATGQARGAALVACAERSLSVGEFTPTQIKLAITGTGAAEKRQIQYMVQQYLGLLEAPHPDHAADALAAAICYTTHIGAGQSMARLDAMVQDAIERDERARELRRHAREGAIVTGGDAG